MDEQNKQVETEPTDLLVTEQPEKTDEKAEKKREPLPAYVRILIGAAVGAIVACLVMWLGFWRIFFVCLMAGLGAFIFGVENKMELIRRTINRIFPGKR